MTIPAINRIYFSNIDKINRIFTHQLLDLEKSAPACRFGQKTMKKSHSYRTFILDIPSGGVYTALICRMKGDSPRLTAPRENASRLKARLGMEGQGTTAGGHDAAYAIQGFEWLSAIRVEPRVQCIRPYSGMDVFYLHQYPMEIKERYHESGY